MDFQRKVKSFEKMQPEVSDYLNSNKYLKTLINFKKEVAKNKPQSEMLNILIAHQTRVIKELEQEYWTNSLEDFHKKHK